MSTVTLKNPKIALLGQPNSGKSTLFNGLTGARQRVGNWPGKTVEKKEGHYDRNGMRYRVTDLPGTYSLSANIVLVLNLMDVAESQGKTVGVEKLEEKLGIPVIPFVAADQKQYDMLIDLFPEEGVGSYSASWLAAKLIEGDSLAIFIILLGLIASFIPAAPIMLIGSLIPKLGVPISEMLSAISVSQMLIDLISQVVLNTLYFAVAMIGFVFGVTLVFGFLEEVGYMARVSYIFDSTMEKLGLQGKEVADIDAINFSENKGNFISGTARYFYRLVSILVSHVQCFGRSGRNFADTGFFGLSNR
ncbi:MAG TPA: hypothetical protein GX726_04735 [Clostridiales bacterium]|jgi:ferrous iron transport protein B|nr:hypothetical protein [Clostridiales bacterium]